LLHAHVIREDDAPEHQSKSLARSAATRRTARARGSLRGPLRNKKREVGKGLSLADTQTGRKGRLYSRSKTTVRWSAGLCLIADRPSFVPLLF
jgi:hypothetical protein